MLLMKLKNEEKFAFLKLAHHIAEIDGEYERKERDIIEECCAEMGIENVKYSDSEFDLENILNKFKSPKSQKIVLLESMILIHSDDKFHRFEEKIINKIAESFNISQNELNIYSQWGKATSALYAQGKIFIGEERDLL